MKTIGSELQGIGFKTKEKNLYWKMGTFPSMVIQTLSYLPSGSDYNKADLRDQFGPCKASGTRETPKDSPRLQML